MLSAINAGTTGTNQPDQAEISTAGRTTSAGRVNNRRTLLINGGKSGCRPALEDSESGDNPISLYCPSAKLKWDEN